MDDLRFSVLFNSVSITSGRWADDNEKLCAMEPGLRAVGKSLPPGTARSVG